MFDLGGSELLLIGVVALIVVGPKDLPNLFRQVGQFTGKARAMAREFSRAMEAAADDSGMKDISKTIKAAANPKAFGTDRIREVAGLKTPAKPKPGPATEALSDERAESRRRVEEATAKAATARKEREAAAAAALDDPAPSTAADAADAAAPAPASPAGPIGSPALPRKPVAKVASKTSAKPSTATNPAEATVPTAAAKPKAPPKPRTAEAGAPCNHSSESGRPPGDRAAHPRRQNRG